MTAAAWAVPIMFALPLLGGCASPEACPHVDAENETNGTTWLHYVLRSDTGIILEEGNITLAPRQTFHSPPHAYGVGNLTLSAWTPQGAWTGPVHAKCHPFSSVLMVKTDGIQALQAIE